jgi:hypothetical protein
LGKYWCSSDDDDDDDDDEIIWLGRVEGREIVVGGF